MHDSNTTLMLEIFRALAVILVVSAICGRLALLIGQPRVVGEMVAGVLLGPTLLGAVAPDFQHTLFSPDVKSVLYALSTIGLTLYMFLVGAGQEEHPGSVREFLRPSAVAISSVAAPLLLGGTAALVLRERLAATGTDTAQFALFVGGALSVTALPVLARILYERNMVKTHFGSLAVLAASIADTIAWFLLAVIIAMGTADGAIRAGSTILLGGLFTVLALIVLPKALRRPAERTATRGTFSYRMLVGILLLVVVAGWFIEQIGMYSVFGGFVIGMAMPRNARFLEMLHTRMMEIVQILFLPLYFAFSGLNTQLGSVFSWSFLFSFFILLLAAFAGKYLFGMFAMRILGFGWRAGSAMGGLMNSQGLMVLIFINIGLSEGIINSEAFSMLVLVAIVNTALAVPIYRRAYSATDEEAMRAAGVRTPATHNTQDTEKNEIDSVAART